MGFQVILITVLPEPEAKIYLFKQMWNLPVAEMPGCDPDISQAVLTDKTHWFTFFAHIFKYRHHKS
jgi:hypothetical protein